MIVEYIALALLLLCCVAGFIALFFTTFGTLIILIGALVYALLTGFKALNVIELVFLAVLYGIGESLEYLFLISGAKRFGASNMAVVGALVGGIIGAVIGTAVFGIGIIPGTFLGIFLGAFGAELIVRRDFVKSLKVGTGATAGRIASIAAKIVVALIMMMIIAVRIIQQPPASRSNRNGNIQYTIPKS